MKKRATTSASNVFRRKLCPGSGRLEDGIEEVDSEYSGEGAMLHTLFKTGNRPETLKVEQAEALNLADYYADEFFGNVRTHFEIPDDAPFVDEREVGLLFYAADGRALFPGHADLIRSWPAQKVRAVIDAKFGFMEIDSAPDNLQLASYAVMRQQVSKAKAVAVAIDQPRNFGPRLSQAMYTADAIKAAAAELEQIVRASEEDDAPLIAGDKQCHFCRAKTKCPAYREKYMAIHAAGARPIQEATNAELEKMHEAIAFAMKVKDDVSGEMRRRILAGEMPGWKLQNSGDDVELLDTMGFYNALRDRFQGEPRFTPKAFDDCRAMQWGKLASLMQTLLGNSEKKAKEFIKLMSEGFVSRVPKAKRIVRERGALPAADRYPRIESSGGPIDGQWEDSPVS